MFRLFLTLIILLSAFNALAAERVVILAPAAADVFYKLGAGDRVAGVTKNVTEFPDAVKVGTHIRPNAEIIRSLRPDLIITGSADEYYADAVKAITGAAVYKYDPLNLEEILTAVMEIGKITGHERQAEALAAELRAKLASVKPLKEKPGVIYEISQLPYIVAGRGNIAASVVSAAGGEILTDSDGKLVKLSVEKAVALQPDVYIWQTGPMNRNPVEPEKRPEFAKMKTKWIHADERKYSRANTGSFDAVLELNSALRKLYE
ncbi:ABC transporter substrate-binding protein [Geovibrio thiophilus]|nr:ABC transporter substrate-binding protein [Geovibrio thiophilus]